MRFVPSCSRFSPCRPGHRRRTRRSTHGVTPTARSCSQTARSSTTDVYTVSGAPKYVTTRPVEDDIEYDRFETLIQEHSTRQALRPELVRAVIQVESGFNPRALSPKGAMGLMQLMPATARSLGVNNPWDPAQNIRGGTDYLRQPARRIRWQRGTRARGLQRRVWRRRQVRSPDTSLSRDTRLRPQSGRGRRRNRVQTRDKSSSSTRPSRSRGSRGAAILIGAPVLRDISNRQPLSSQWAVAPERYSSHSAAPPTQPAYSAVVRSTTVDHRRNCCSGPPASPARPLSRCRRRSRR